MTRVKTRTDAPNKTKVVWRDCRAKPIKNERTEMMTRA